MNLCRPHRNRNRNRNPNPNPFVIEPVSNPNRNPNFKHSAKRPKSPSLLSTMHTKHTSAFPPLLYTSPAVLACTALSPCPVALLQPITTTFLPPSFTNDLLVAQTLSSHRLTVVRAVHTLWRKGEFRESVILMCKMKVHDIHAIFMRKMNDQLQDE